MKLIREPEMGESAVWDIGEAAFYYLLLAICMAGALR
jgi:hypothetical protein